MPQRLLQNQKETAHNGDDYIRRLSKAAARRQLKRSAERSKKPWPSAGESPKESLEPPKSVSKL